MLLLRRNVGYQSNIVVPFFHAFYHMSRVPLILFAQVLRCVFSKTQAAYYFILGTNYNGQHVLFLTLSKHNTEYRASNELIVEEY